MPGGLWWAALALLAGCAELPVAPPAPVPEPVVPRPRTALSEAQLAHAVAKHRKLAEDARKAGDHAAAAAQWQILMLLAPADARYPRELAATRAAIASGVRDSLHAGTSAMAAGDLDVASVALLRALALDPANAEAAKALREIDRRRLARIQAAASTRAARTTVTIAPEHNDAFDIEQALELFRAGDAAGGLRDLRAFVDANPRDRAARHRIGAIVADRARELEEQGAREQALGLYEQASALRGDGNGPWTARLPALRKALSGETYDRALRVYRTDLTQAVKLLEASVKYDPANTQAAIKLKEAKVAQANLERIERRRK